MAAKRKINPKNIRIHTIIPEVPAPVAGTCRLDLPRVAKVSLSSGQQIPDHLPMDIGEAEITACMAVGELFMVKAQ